MIQKKSLPLVSLLVLLIFISVFLTIFFFSQYSNKTHEGRIKTFNQLIGSYQLDIAQTKLGSFEKDSTIYKNLIFTFKSDSTFYVNMRVPFLHDTLGKWRAGNYSEWCWLFFENFGYTKNMYHDTNPGGIQFTRPYEKGLDTFFLLPTAWEKNSVIYFKKIKRNN